MRQAFLQCHPDRGGSHEAGTACTAAKSYIDRMLSVLTEEPRPGLELLRCYIEAYHYIRAQLDAGVTEELVLRDRRYRLCPFTSMVV